MCDPCATYIDGILQQKVNCLVGSDLQKVDTDVFEALSLLEGIKGRLGRTNHSPRCNALIDEAIKHKIELLETSMAPPTVVPAGMRDPNISERLPPYYTLRASSLVSSRALCSFLDLVLLLTTRKSPTGLGRIIFELQDQFRTKKEELAKSREDATKAKICVGEKIANLEAQVAELQAQSEA